MQFESFPFDVHDCDFRVQSLETPSSALRFRFIPDTAGIIWKTQTILEHSVSFEKLQEVSLFCLVLSFNLRAENRLSRLPVVGWLSFHIDLSDITVNLICLRSACTWLTDCLCNYVII